MRTVTAAFQAELDKKTGAQPRKLLEIDAIGSTLYVSDQTVVVDAQTYSPKVLNFGNLTSQIVPGEEVVRVASMSFRLSNIVYIDDLIVAGTVVRVYDWFEGLATADKALAFKGTIVGEPGWDDREISFRCNDIFQKFNKVIGRPLLAADWTNADPDYLGRTIPLLIGAGKNLEGLPIEAGAASTLREEFTPSDTIIKLTSTEEPLAFPSSGTVIIGTVEYTHTGKSSNNLTGVPNPAITHPQGSVVLEKTNLKFLAGESFSDTPVKALTNLRILPFNSRKVAEAVGIDSAFYTIDLTETISGNVYATIVLTQIAAIRKAVSFAITQQPDQPITTQPNQPITTQQTQVSPVHGHTQANVTVAYFMNSISGSGIGSVNGARIVDGNTAEGATLTGISSGDWLRVHKDLIENLGGALVSAVVKTRVWTSSGSINFTLKYLFNGVTKVSQGKTATTSPTTFSTSSFSLSGGAWSDFQNGNTYIEIVFNTSTASGFFNAESWLELIYTPANPTFAVTVNESVAAISNRTTDAASNRITDVVVGGDTVADTLLGSLICDYEGCQDKSDGHYTGSSSALIEKPPDVIHFFWEKFSNNAVHADLDIAGSFLDARTNLPGSYKYGFALTWQVDLATLSAQLAQQSHCRFFTSAGLAKFVRILTSGTPVKTIDTDDYSPLTGGEEKKLRVNRRGGAIEKVINRVEIFYAHNPVLGPRGNTDAYAGNAEDFNQDSIDAYGERKPRKPWLMWAVRDSDMADDLQVKFLGRNQYPRTQTIFPSWPALALMEPSDLVELTSSKLRMADRLSEILQLGNTSPVPKNFQPGEVVITVLDLLFILINLTDEAQIGDAFAKLGFQLPADTAQIGDAFAKLGFQLPADTAQIGDAVKIDINLGGLTSPWAEKAPQLGSETFIYALAVFNNKLYGVTHPNGKLYEWNGTNAWVEKAPQEGALAIRTLIVFNSKLYGGTFNGRLLEWNGSNAWVEKAPTLNGEGLRSLAVFNSKLYGGTGGNGKLYEWNGTNAWVEKAPHLGGVGDANFIFALAVFNSKLYGGTGSGGQLYEWNGTNAWVEKAPQFAEDFIYSLAVFNSKLYGGTAPGGKLFEWNGSNAWIEKAPQEGAENQIPALIVFNNQLYGGTVPNGKLYEWNGSNAWVEKAPTLTETYIQSLAVFNNKLYGGTGNLGKLYEWALALGENIGVGDVLTLLKSLWKFDSTRKYDSSKKFNSAP